MELSAMLGVKTTGSGHWVPARGRFRLRHFLRSGAAAP